MLASVICTLIKFSLSSVRNCVLILTPAFVNPSSYCSVRGSAPVLAFVLRGQTFNVDVAVGVVYASIGRGSDWVMASVQCPIPDSLIPPPLLVLSLLPFLSFSPPPKLHDFLPPFHVFHFFLLFHHFLSSPPSPTTSCLQSHPSSSRLFLSFHHIFLFLALVLTFSFLLSNPYPLLRYSCSIYSLLYPQCMINKFRRYA